MRRLLNPHIVSGLVEATPLTAIVLLMRGFMSDSVRISGICRDFAGNRVNESGNMPRCGTAPEFYGLEVIAIDMTAGACGDVEIILWRRVSYALHCRVFVSGLHSSAKVVNFAVL